MVSPKAQQDDLGVVLAGFEQERGGGGQGKTLSERIAAQRSSVAARASGAARAQTGTRQSNGSIIAVNSRATGNSRATEISQSFIVGRSPSQMNASSTVGMQARLSSSWGVAGRVISTFFRLESIESEGAHTDSSFEASPTPERHALNSGLGESALAYEAWPKLGSRSRWYCAGRCITGPEHDFALYVGTWCCITVPSLFFYAIVAPDLWERDPWLPMVSTVLLVASLVLWCFTRFTDPGIIPRPEFQHALPGLADDVVRMVGTPPIVLDDDTGLAVNTLMQEQINEGYRWCDTCKLVRPPRAAHCRDCNNCVLRFDHHCPFLNNCIGLRNYLFFKGFLFTGGCWGLLTAVSICLWFFQGHEGVKLWIVAVLGVLIGMPLFLVVLPLLLVLGGFHIFISCQGKTTKEYWNDRPIPKGIAAQRPMRTASLVPGRRTMTTLSSTRKAEEVL